LYRSFLRGLLYILLLPWTWRWSY